jgi:hypothetical protein
MMGTIGITPGDWRFDAKPGLPIYVYAHRSVAGPIPPMRVEVAVVSGLEDGINNDARRREQLANARVIAALPDLLAALNRIATGLTVDVYDERAMTSISAAKAARAAITRAQGETT